jgi:hypothetical protein
MQVTLSRSSWHYRLQTIILGTPRFTNFCPYFWWTIFCLIASIFYFPFMGIGWVFNFFGRKMDKVLNLVIDCIETIVCEPLDRMFISRLDDAQVLEIYSKSRAALAIRHDTSPERAYDWYDSSVVKKKYKKMNAKFEIWRKLNAETWETKLAEMSKRQTQLCIEKNKTNEAALRKYKADLKLHRERVALRAEKARKIQLKLVSITQKIVPVVVVVLVAGLGFLLFRLGVVMVHLVRRINWAAVFPVMIVWGIRAVILFAIIGLLVGFLVLFHTLLTKCTLIIPKDLSNVFVKVGGRIASPFVWFGLGIKKVFFNPIAALVLFIVEYVKIAKKDHCPQILWRE